MEYHFHLIKNIVLLEVIKPILLELIILVKDSDMLENIMILKIKRIILQLNQILHMILLSFILQEVD